MATSRRRYGLLARGLFLAMDLLYGRERSLAKFKVLELVALVPYQAWEQVAHAAIPHRHRMPGFARRVFGFVREARAQQDNEHWHLLILEEQLARQGVARSGWRFRAMPQLLAFFYFHVSWLLYVIKPSLSYRLNADFEDHSEHEYMEFVHERYEMEDQPWISDFVGDYGQHESLADVLRHIGLDERRHKLASLAHIDRPRFE